ncbi:hypothetical protein MLD38_035779 [Melastoma candidum]|uniref:Uncharacterized protein n=1 Tax=Melastoma candidum TaxID=119954 RepID=A0ACB9LIV3_9MYRT|nr:hypothetical protein MLD38_035779 [Melastoma candidum]
MSPLLAPISFISLAHLVFYVSVAQSLCCINGFKFHRRCHKLTLGLATERLRELLSWVLDEDNGGHTALMATYAPRSIPSIQ